MLDVISNYFMLMKAEHGGVSPVQSTGNAPSDSKAVNRGLTHNTN